MSTFADTSTGWFMDKLRLIEKVDFTQTALDEEYIDCKFLHCNFSDTALADTSFDTCTFEHCNLMLSRLLCSFRDIKFIECKMTGTDFTHISRFSYSLSFEKSQLNYANFFGTKLRKLSFTDCNLTEAYFDEADISSSVFAQCDLSRTSFFHTNLEKVDFSTAYNFSINPTTNRLRKAIFSAQDLRGLVSHLDLVFKE